MDILHCIEELQYDFLALLGGWISCQKVVERHAVDVFHHDGGSDAGIVFFQNGYYDIGVGEFGR